MGLLMKWTRGVSVAVSAGVVAVAVGCGSGHPQKTERVNADTIRSVKVGMSQQEVRAILGPPLKVEPWGTNTVLLRYAIPGWLRRSPSLWVAFDHGAVSTVHATVHPVVADDRAVYEAAAHHGLFETAEFEATFGR